MAGRLLLGAALLFLPSTALACTCDDSRAFSAAEIDKAARYLVEGGFVVAEVERLASLAPAPDRYRIVRQRLGPSLGKEVLVASGTQLLPDGSWIAAPQTSCDPYPVPVQTTRLVVFRPVRSPGDRPSCGVLPKGNFTEWRRAGQCTEGLLDNPAILSRAVLLARAQAGVSRSSLPPSSSR